MQTVLTLVKKSIASRPCSCGPIPDAFTPPNGKCTSPPSVG
jgi:hypothetical protein